jgi:tetratricopeptide (TPR) repeat protein
LTLAAAERLRQHTRGHPLYVRALLAELPPDALAFEQGPLPAPHSFAATVLARLTSVATDTQDLVAAASVVGARCPVTLAAAVAGVSDPLTALDEALAADLLPLLPARIPEEVSFPHPPVRAAVYDDLSPARRRSLHLACARLTSSSASLAHRVAASQGADDALARELASTAEAEVAAGQLAAGVEQLLWASRVAATRQLRETALLRAVECLLLSGDVPGACSLREEVLSCGDSSHRSFVIGALTASVGHLAEAEQELRDVMARPDFPMHPELVGQVTSSLAIVYAYLGRGTDAIGWAHRALDAEGSPATVAVTATQALAVGLIMSGQGRESIAVLDSVSVSRIDPEPFEAELLATRGTLKSWSGDLPGAVEDLSAVIDWSRAGTPVRSLPNAYASLAEVEYRLGQWDEGLTHAEVAVSLGEDADRSWDLPFAHAVTSYLHAGRGNRGIAAEHVAAASRAAEMVPLPICIYYACTAAAHLAGMRRDWDSLLLELEPLHEPLAGGLVAGLGQRVRWLRITRLPGRIVGDDRGPLSPGAVLCSSAVRRARGVAGGDDRAGRAVAHSG